MAGQVLCIRCSCPLGAPSATGLCSACALLSTPTDPQTASLPVAVPGAPPRDDTPRGFDDRTPADAPPARAADAPTVTAADQLAATAPPPAPDARPALPGVPGYTLFEKIGRGGMGDVYLALEHASNRSVALKFLRDPGDPALLRRFELEFCASANLNHPNAVRVLGHDFQRADPYFVMELMEGGSVAQRLRSAGPLVPTDAVALVRKVALAVQALHEQSAGGDAKKGIIHRDIKPGNILLTKEGEPKLADFGLVKFLDAATAPTHTGDVLGTAQYMPPEQLNRKNGELDCRADVYGLGATLYHLLTGRAPFTGDTVREIFHAVLTELPVPPDKLVAELHPGLNALVLRALAKDPDARFRSVAEFVAALDTYQNWVPPPPPRLFERVGAWARRNRSRVATACVAVAATVTVAVALALPKQKEGWEAVESDLDRDKRAELVPARGLPRWSQTHLAPAALGPDPANEGACAFQTSSSTFVELARDPRSKKYRVTFDLRQLLGDPPPPGDPMPIGYVGAYFGHQSWQTGPWRMHAAAAVRFTDFLAFDVPGKRPDTPARFGLIAVAQHPDRLPTFDWRGGPGTLPFDPKPNRTWPGLWRTVRFEVDPDGVRALWWNPPANGKPGAFVPIARLTAAELNARFAAVAKPLRQHAPEDTTVPSWNPRNPIGVYADRAAVAVRNVVLEID